MRSENIADVIDPSIKWTRAVKNDLLKGLKLTHEPKNIVKSLYRPFFTMRLYYSRKLNEMQYQIPSIFRGSNQRITLSGTSASKPFSILATDQIFRLNLLEKTQCLPLYRYDKAGNRLENVTNWGLNQFRTHYKDESISRQDIFNYVYGVLHDPAYRKKYELNLRREFPRIPFYEDFAQWAAWGANLMKLHLEFETVEQYPLQRVDLPNVANPKAKLRADKAAGEIVLDTETTLSGVPVAAWDYKLGNRSALEWVLERYKGRTPKDKTVAEKFNTYRFADYKEDVILLLGRVCAVSVQTSEIIREMAGSGSE